MQPSILLIDAINPGFSLVATINPKIVVSNEARVEALAIWGQESNWSYRRQMGGPARSYGQFEKGGGVHGVLTHAASRDTIVSVCAKLDIPCDEATVYEAMAWNDVLAAAMTRLLLYTDARPLPKIGDVNGGWAYYLDIWRPGMPHPQTWPLRYATARETVGV